MITFPLAVITSILYWGIKLIKLKPKNMVMRKPINKKNVQ